MTRTSDWRPDILGGSFEMKHIGMPDDYSGAIHCTVVRLKATSSHWAAVYVHGFSDYYFQRELAEAFVAHDISFYAVDLRKYGRSLIDGQRMFQLRDMREYFPDIKAAIDTAVDDGASGVILIGHSTGGLSTSLFMEQMPHPAVKALILNSPFLAWNLPAWMRRFVVPIVSAIGKYIPAIPVKSGGTIDYGRSLARHLGGEWTYDNKLKPDIMPDVDAGWIRAIDRAQKALRKGSINVPVLLLHSARSAYPGDGAEKFSDADGVLNVNAIAAAGRKLGNDVTEVSIDGGLHDLVLSRPAVRREVYNTIFSWLSSTLGICKRH